MKSSYELAMERLDKAAPTTRLSPNQKKEIAELESRCKAKIAERELALQGETAAAASAGEFEKVAQLQQQLVIERKKLQSDLEAKKEQIHKPSGRK